MVLADRFGGSPTRTDQDYFVQTLNVRNDLEMATWRLRLRQEYGSAFSVGWRSDQQKIRAIFFDMDSTMVEEETLVEMAATIGRRDEVSRITESAMCGEMDFVTSLQRRLALMAGTDQQIFDTMLAKLTINPHFDTLIAACRARGTRTYVVSGGFTQLAYPVAQRLQMNGVCANELEVKNGALTGQIVGQVIDANAKALFVAQTCAEIGCDLGAVAVVGDGANDIPMMKIAGLSIGYRPKPVTWDHIQAYVGDGDFRFVDALIKSDT